jgi:hypothetical protein
MKRQQFFNSRRISFFEHEVVPYFLFPYLGSHSFFFCSIISSQYSTSSGILSNDEYKPSFICGIPIQRWIDQACGYSFQQNFLPPTHLHELFSIIDCMFIYAHDYFVLELSLLYYMIKNRGRYLDEMLSRWLHWFYDFTQHI